MGTDGSGAKLETGPEDSRLWWKDSFLTKVERHCTRARETTQHGERSREHGPAVLSKAACWRGYDCLAYFGGMGWTDRLR